MTQPASPSPSPPPLLHPYIEDRAVLISSIGWLLVVVISCLPSIESSCFKLISNVRMSNPQMHTKKCEYLKVPCVHSECGMLVKKSALQEHMENECICRLQRCDYCKKGVKRNLMEASLVRCVYSCWSFFPHLWSRQLRFLFPLLQK